MALNAEIHLWIQRQVGLEVGAMQFVTAQAGHRLIGAPVDDLRADRVRGGMRALVASRAQIHAGAREITCILGPMWSMATGAIHPVVRQNAGSGLVGEFTRLEMTTRT